MAWFVPVMMAAAAIAGTATSTAASEKQKKNERRKMDALDRDISQGRGLTKEEENLYYKAETRAQEAAQTQATAAQSEYERLAAASGGSGGGAAQATLRREKDRRVADVAGRASQDIGLAKAEANAAALAQKRAEREGRDATVAAITQGQIASGIRGAAQVAGALGQAAAYEKQAPSGLLSQQNYSKAQQQAMTPPNQLTATNPATGKPAAYTPLPESGSMSAYANTGRAPISEDEFDLLSNTGGQGFTDTRAGISQQELFSAYQAIRDQYPQLSEQEALALLRQSIAQVQAGGS